MVNVLVAILLGNLVPSVENVLEGLAIAKSACLGVTLKLGTRLVVILRLNWQLIVVVYPPVAPVRRQVRIPLVGENSLYPLWLAVTREVRLITDVVLRYIVSVW